MKQIRSVTVARVLRRLCPWLYEGFLQVKREDDLVIENEIRAIFGEEPI